MRGIEDIVFTEAKRAEIIQAADKAQQAKRKASLRRLKQRISNMVFDKTLRQRLIKVVDIWDAAEQRKGTR